MFHDMILSIAARQSTPGCAIEKVEARAKSKAGRKSKSGRLESNADAFLKARGFDENGEPISK